MYSLVGLEDMQQKPGPCARGGKLIHQQVELGLGAAKEHLEALQVSPLPELVLLRYHQCTSHT